ncbi:hypothetical protein M5K25_004583 [Dendrobium thyrsiflorum]|uniref:Uncharacterized protein n=1 Tax=Dendrobium thyrsiflorum TaxID=117978 RepID=A0ABD0VF85_DENTH
MKDLSSSNSSHLISFTLDSTKGIMIKRIRYTTMTRPVDFRSYRPAIFITVMYFFFLEFLFISSSRNTAIVAMVVILNF